jgi:predicted dehydrogenase
MDEKLSVGIVGLGLVATPHCKGYASHPHAEVRAVCDLDGERAKGFAREHGIPEVFTSYEEMLASEIDVVDIATPTFLHAAMTRQAAEAGKHVHCEKPFCRSVDEGMAACAAARENGVKLVVGETYVFISSHVKARELIEAGEIGRPLQIRQRHGAWLERPEARVYTGPPDRNWRVDAEQSGGGAYPWIFDHAVHFFASAEYFMLDGKIDEVYAVQATGASSEGPSGAAHDPYATAEVDIPIITWKFAESDCQGVWMRAERLNGKYDYMRGFSTAIIGEKGMIEVLGEGGHNLMWNGEQQHLILHREGKEATCFRFDEGGDDVWESDISYYSRGHIEQVHHLLDCIVGDREPRYCGEDGVHAVRCTLATIVSGQEGRPVKVEDVRGDYTAY